jgi:hypothetical protein
MMTLVQKILGLHERLDGAGLPYGFGGALALAWCTQEPRGTSDVDVNVFVEANEVDRVLAAIGDVVNANESERESLVREGQVRLWWDVTPVDLFLNNTPFHHDVATRVRHYDFAGARLPFLSCDDLAVFKAFFNRPKDWVDLGTMLGAGTLRVGRLTDTLIGLLGADDERVRRLQKMLESDTA